MPCKCIGGVDVVIFRSPDSAEGRLAKQFFDRKGVAYEDLDISADLQAFQRMQTLSGQTEHPVIMVDDRIFVGFEPGALEPYVPSFF
jgi:glutaredoxin